MRSLRRSEKARPVSPGGLSPNCVSACGSWFPERSGRRQDENE
jgi:hypothetical protein